MRLRFIAILTTLGTLTTPGCSERSSIRLAGPLELGARESVIIPPAPVDAPGPTHEFCLVPVGHDLVARNGFLYDTAGHQVELHVVMIALGGRRDSLWREPSYLRIAGEPPESWPRVRGGPPSYSWLTPKELCAWAHLPPPPRGRYAQFSVRASRPLRVREVRWWSGQRIIGL